MTDYTAIITMLESTEQMFLMITKVEVVDGARSETKLIRVPSTEFFYNVLFIFEGEKLQYVDVEEGE